MSSTAPIFGYPRSPLGNCRLEPFMCIRDHQLDTAQATPGESAKEGCPKSLGLGGGFDKGEAESCRKMAFGPPQGQQQIGAVVQPGVAGGERHDLSLTTETASKSKASRVLPGGRRASARWRSRRRRPGSAVSCSARAVRSNRPTGREEAAVRPEAAGCGHRRRDWWSFIPLSLAGRCRTRRKDAGAPTRRRALGRAVGAPPLRPRVPRRVARVSSRRAISRHPAQSYERRMVAPTPTIP